MQGGACGAFNARSLQRNATQHPARLFLAASLAGRKTLIACAHGTCPRQPGMPSRPAGLAPARGQRTFISLHASPFSSSMKAMSADASSQPERRKSAS